MASNWAPAQVPTVFDDATIGNGGTANANAAVGVLGLNVGRVVGASNSSGTVNVTTGGLTGAGTGQLVVGSTDNNFTSGTANGTVSVDGNVSGFFLTLVGSSGFASSGNATGDLNVGGSLQGGANLLVGTSAGSADAVGIAVIGNGISDIGLVNVGTSGSSANTATASATGELSVLAGGIQGTGSDLRIGVTTGPGTAMGTVTVTGGISNFSDVRVGNVQLSLAAADSGPATGVLNIQTGNLTGAGTGQLVVGSTDNNFTSGTANGTVSVDGNVSGFFLTLVGSSGFASSGNATGDLNVGGSLQGGANLLVGTSAGSADAVGIAVIGNGISDIGLVNVGTSGSSANTATASATGELSVLAGGIQGTGSDLRIGVTTGPGTAMGTVTVTGGISNFSDVRVGNVQLSLAAADSGPATGSLSLIDGGLSATNLVIGVTEAPNTATATGTFDLNKNLAEVADTLTLGNGATISLDFEGFLRGVEYGAINANQAILDGTLELNFLFQPAFGVFDLIVSGSDTGITGDFDSVQFFGLADGTLTNFGIVLDQGVETWRLQIGPAQIPEPGTLIAVTTALVLLGLTRRRRASL
ncbi:MAG: PEP-CTERM sorting domain-containing protein [Burkholderiales bacterium]|nr:PEP-CTERM sorting domain-containing protein [Burkholderiales bacterium]